MHHMAFFYIGAALFSSWLVQGRNSFPMGINFGPRNVTATRLSHDGQDHMVISLFGGAKYRSLISDSLNHQGHKILRGGDFFIQQGDQLIPASPDPDRYLAEEELFKEIIGTIKDLASHQDAQYEPEISSVSVPQHFNNSVTGAVWHALDSEAGITRPWQIRSYFNVVRRVYDLEAFSNPHLNLDSETILFVDLNIDYIQIFAAELDEEIFMEIAQGIRLLAYSEDEKQTYQDEMRNMVSDFITSQLKTDKDTATPLRAIILSGDAPADAISLLRMTILEHLPDQEHLVHDSVDPGMVGAMGAAAWAKLQVEQPKLLDDVLVNEIPLEGHDEL